MDKFRDYLENNFKLAYKSVTFHFKKYAHFYIVIFIIQLLLSLITVSLSINKMNAENQIKEQYDSHCVFYYMNTNQKYYLKKTAVYYFENDHYMDIKEIKDYGKEEEYDYRCDVSVLFAEDPVDGLALFNKKYMSKLEALGPVYMSTTPLYDLESTLLRYDVLYSIYFLIATAFSMVLLGILYSIRSMGSGFEYGIYTSFGADRKKLFNTSFWELTVISFLTLIPATVCSGIFNYILSKAYGTEFTIGIRNCFITCIFTLIIIAVSVFFVIRKIAKKTPVTLLMARDNSNWVHSPRVSANIFTPKKTLKMRLLGFTRYYKFYATVTLSSVLFASLFVCGGYSSMLFNQKQSAEDPQFRVTYTGSSVYTEKDSEYFMGFDGIVGTHKEESTTAMKLNAHILIHEDNTSFTADTIDYDDTYQAFDMVNYFAADKEVVSNLQSNDYSGDLTSVLNSPSTVIISDSYSNSTFFEFKPGDIIKLAFFIEATAEPEAPLQGNDLLEFRLENYIFTYKEVTVGAVIHDENSEFMNIYVSHDLYKELTGITPKYRTVNLYIDENLSSREVKKLYSDILRINRLEYRDDDNSVSVFVENLHTSFEKQLEESTAFSVKLLAVAFFMLAFSIIIWFFTQLNFYKKRNNEYILLRSIGFTSKDIRKSFFTDAITVSLISLILYFAVSYLLCYGIYYIMNSWIFDYSVRYTFNIPTYIILIGAITTVLTAFLSTMINYFSYKKTDVTVPKD